MGGLCSEDNQCNLDDGGGNSSSPGIQRGCHRSPCLTGSHFKSPCAVSNCPLALLSTPYLLFSAPTTHSHTHSNFSSLITQQCAATTVSLGHLCSLPTQGRWHVFDGQNHCTVYLLCLLSSKHTTAWGRESMSEWHVCTAQCLQKRFNVDDMLFCLLLCMSPLISSMDKQLECAPLKATSANQKCWGARYEEQSDVDLKMSTGIAFLIVYSHFSMHWCTWSCLRLLVYLNSAFCPYFFFLIELVGMGKN